LSFELSLALEFLLKIVLTSNDGDFNCSQSSCVAKGHFHCCIEIFAGGLHQDMELSNNVDVEHVDLTPQITITYATQVDFASH